MTTGVSQQCDKASIGITWSVSVCVLSQSSPPCYAALLAVHHDSGVTKRRDQNLPKTFHSSIIYFFQQLSVFCIGTESNRGNRLISAKISWLHTEAHGEIESKEKKQPESQKNPQRRFVPNASSWTCWTAVLKTAEKFQAAVSHHMRPAWWEMKYLQYAVCSAM